MKQVGRGKKRDVKPVSGRFGEVSATQWRQSIEKGLKKGEYERKLVWRPADGMAVEPFYCAAHTRGLSLSPAPAPGNFPFTREEARWMMCEDIPPVSAARAAKLARDGIEGGADWVFFREAKIRSSEEVEKLLAGIDPSEAGVCFAPGDGGIEQAETVADFAAKTGAELKGFVLCDPLGCRQSGENRKGEIKRLAKLVHRFADASDGYGCVGISGARFRAAGANAVEETAFALALGAEYLVTLGENGVPARKAAMAAVFHFSADSVFFMEIARLRAARAVWAHIVERFDHGAEGRMRIHVSPSPVNKSVCDPEVNILRATGEAMAAVIGGCNSLSIPAFDRRYATDTKKSQMLARNTQLILREECGLDRVADPCAGSYYTDVLTDKVADAVLRLFLEIEQRGGFLKCAGNGFISEHVARGARERREKIAAGTEPLIGVNKYPIEGEQVLDRLKRGKNLCAGAEFERMRATTEKRARERGGKFPSVLLIKTGDPAMRSARAVFAANFFAVAGFEIRDGGEFNRAGDARRVALKSDADIFVLCAEDGGYAEFAPPFAAGVKKERKDAVIVIAGNPAEEDRSLFLNAGVDEFINTRSNILQTLRKMSNAAGAAEKGKGGKKR